MEIKFNNMLEVVELIESLEYRISWYKEYIPGDTLSVNALLNIYNQIRRSYNLFVNFHYDELGNEIKK